MARIRSHKGAFSYFITKKAERGGEMSRKGGAPENLDPVRTKEEAKKRGSNGGKKSGEVRRAKRDAKSAAKLILDLPCTENISRNLKSMNISEEDFTNRVGIMARLFAEAMSGNVSAMRTMIEFAGELPHQQLDEKRFETEVENKQKGNNAVDDWVTAVLEADEQENDNGKEQ